MVVSTSIDKTVKLWDIHKDAECIFTFHEHITYIWSSVFLKVEKAIATGDDSGYILVWSIKRYSENNKEEVESQNIASNTGQDPIIAKP